MIEIILSLISALISYLGAKAAGAKDSTALGVAAAAGLGTYYVATETDWGKGTVKSLGAAWDRAFASDGNALVDEKGRDVYVPPGVEPVTRPRTGTDPGTGGFVAVLDAAGNVVTTLGSKAIETTGDTLQSWGPAGTSGVILTKEAVKSPETNKTLLYGGLALGALLLLR